MSIAQTLAKTLTAVGAATFLLAAPAAFAQSAGTSLGGTSNGKPGGPEGSGATGSSTAETSSGTTGASQMAKPGDTPGNSGSLGKGTAEQHEKLGN